MKIAAIDIGGTAIKYCLHNAQSPFEKKVVHEIPTGALQGGTAVMARVKEIISLMDGVDSIAISTAGQVNPVSGSIIYATDNIPGYTGTPIKEIMETTFKVPVIVENDVNAAALGESAFGAGRDYSDFLCLTYGTGIGGAIIINNKIYYGSSYSAAEMGHLITHANGLQCTCGSRGCYEAYASTTALIRSVKENSGLELNGRQIFAAMKNNPIIESAVIAWIDEIMWGLVSLVHVFNPPCIILGGGIMNEVFIHNYIQQNIKRYLMKSYQHVVIKQASLGNTAGLQGMIHLAQTQLAEGAVASDIQ